MHNGFWLMGFWLLSRPMRRASRLHPFSNITVCLGCEVFLLTVQKQQLQALNPSWICYDWRNFTFKVLYTVYVHFHIVSTRLHTYLTLTLTLISPLCNASMPLFDQQQHLFGCTKWSNSNLKIYWWFLIIVIVTICKLTENRLIFVLFYYFFLKHL